MKYLKWIYGTRSNSSTNLEYKVDEINIAENGILLVKIGKLKED